MILPKEGRLKKGESMKLRIENHNPFLCPPGYHPAICTGLWQLNERAADGQQMVRLGFEVFPNAGDPNRTYKAGKNYPSSLAPGSALREDMENWLGDAPFSKEGEFDTDQLVGQPALLLMKHYQNEGYPQPYVYIAHIAPAVERVQARVIVPLNVTAK
jgi:hypothetical protein